MSRRDTVLALVALAAMSVHAEAQLIARSDAVADAPNADWASAQLVTVQMVDDRFIPNKLVFRRGVPYRLHLENKGTDIHEFTAPEFFHAIAIRNPDVLEQTRQDEVFLQPKEQKDLYFVAKKPGLYRLTCANHEWDNMVGDITIE